MPINRRTTATAEAAPAAEDYAPADEGFTAEDENNVTPINSGARRGWGAAKKAVEKSSKYETEFKVTEEDQLIKFLEDEPFWAGATHWVDEIKDGKRSFYCLDDECPLCGVGHETRASIWFNVVPLSDENGPVTPQPAILKAGSLLSKLIEEEHDGRYGPISRHYWRIKKSGGGKKGKVNYTLSVVKAGDLAAEWDLNPEEVAAALANVKPYDDSVVRYTSAEDLQDVVDEHLV